MPQIRLPMTWAELQAAALDTEVSVALVITGLPTAGSLDGMMLEADEADPFSTYRRSSHQLQVRWTPETKIVMGESSDLTVGALIRASGSFDAGYRISAHRLVILTRVVRIVES
jgi:hypothetical protein